MALHIFEFVIASVLADVLVGEQLRRCRDMDTQACMLFKKAKPDLCSDTTFSKDTCVRFCGNCPLECYDCPNPVKQVSDCSTTLCGLNQTCMLKHFTGSDGQEEYIMRCEDKALCEGLLKGFYSVPVGRRYLPSNQNEEWNNTSKRDVSLSLSCCDTDFCNFPKISSSTTTTTTTTSTTMKTPTTTTTVQTSPGLFPNGCNRDIVFVMDDSGNIGSTNFRHALDFVKSITKEIDIGPTKAQISLIAYSTHPQVGWYLNRYDNKIDVMNAVNNVHYIGGATHTQEAIETVRTHILTPQHGDRPNASNVVLVMTDGQSNNHIETIKEAHLLHQLSKYVISIVIGSGINVNELNAIATDSHHVFDLRSYTALRTILQQLMQIICNE